MADCSEIPPSLAKKKKKCAESSNYLQNLSPRMDSGIGEEGQGRAEAEGGAGRGQPGTAGLEPTHLKQGDGRLGVGVSAAGFHMFQLPSSNLGTHCPLSTAFLSLGMNLSATEILFYEFTNLNCQISFLIEAHP